MAESVREKVTGSSNSRSLNDDSGNFECAVCLQTCIHPAELPCGHIFCYLCIKGIVNQGRRCAMCRQDIPVDYLDKPKLLKPVNMEALNEGFEDGHLWFYEGHNGWWQYDERTSLELETAYQKQERNCELLIAGFLYIADFDAMLQYRCNDPSRRRRIKRDLATTNKKGVAGLKPTKEITAISSVHEQVSNELIQSLPISRQSILDTIDGMRLLSLSDRSLSSSSQQNQQSEQRQSNRNLPTLNSTCNSNTFNYSNTETSREEYNFRDFDLNSIIHDTLDWTIEQIESLNLELLNDYEILFRGVNSYNNVYDNIDRNRSSSLSNNHHDQMSNSRTILNRSTENDSDSTPRSQNSSRNRISSLVEPISVPQEAPLQTAPRNRVSRIRSRVMHPR